MSGRSFFDVRHVTTCPTMTARLRRHAAKYHGHARRWRIVQNYFKASDSFGRAAMRQHAAHVAAWLAYGPPAYVPGVSELRLLTKLLDGVGSGLLPTRLQEVLPDAHTALQAASSGSAHSEAWEQAASRLKQRLRKFQCCRRHARPSAIVSMAATSKAALADKPVAEEKTGDVSPGACAVQAVACAGRQQLFRKMNAWTNMDRADRAECLRCAEALSIAKPGITQVQLAEVLCQVAAALSPPRKTALQEDEGEAAHDTCLEAGSETGAPGDLQRRVRKLLLEALKAWRANGFDCGGICYILEHVQQQIQGFQDKAGHLKLAASAAAWLAIQQQLSYLLQDALDEVEGVAVKRRRLTRPTNNFVARGAKKDAMLTAMAALGGQATNEQLIRYVRGNPQVFEQDGGVVERSLKSFRASAYFQRQGQKDGEDLFGFADPCPTGVRRQKHGFTARMQIRSSACCIVGPLRSTVEDACRDYQQLKEWRANMSPEALIQRMRGWQDAHVVSSRQQPSLEREKQCCFGDWGWGRNFPKECHDRGMHQSQFNR